MDLYDQLGNVEAQVTLTIAQSTLNSYLMPFKHRNNSEVPVWVTIIDRNDGDIVEGGILSQERMVTLKVAAQAGFAVSANDAEPVIPGDTFVDQKNFRTLSVAQNGIRPNKYNSVYVLHCISHKALSSGVVK
jgi:hypothetical protein